MRRNLDTTNLLVPGIGLIFPWVNTLPVGVGAVYEVHYNDAAYSQLANQIAKEIDQNDNLPAGPAKDKLQASLEEEWNELNSVRNYDATIFKETPITAGAGTQLTDQTVSSTHPWIGVDPNVLHDMIVAAKAAGVPVHTDLITG